MQLRAAAQPLSLAPAHSDPEREQCSGVEDNFRVADDHGTNPHAPVATLVRLKLGAVLSGLDVSTIEMEVRA